MDTTEMAIATMTWARDAAEEALLKAAFQHLAKLRIPVFITDGGSPAAFLAFLARFPQFTVQRAVERGPWLQTKASLLQAYEAGASYIFYTESDKADFFMHHLPQLLRTVDVNARSGIVLAARSAAGFATFPSFQQLTETTINACCREVVGQPFDYVYGPFLLHRNVVPHLQALPAAIGWGWRPYAFSIATRLGYAVSAFEGDFFCPPSQRHDDVKERVYRMRQLSQNMEGLALSTTVSLPGA